jgi:glycogen debranching enzyme
MPGSVKQNRDDEARAILAANDRGGHTVPNARAYPFQWNWDSAFVATGFATFDEDRAWREIETLMRGQWPDGMVPHIVFHSPTGDYYPGPDAWGTPHHRPTTGISQPPVFATALRMLWERSNEPPALRSRLMVLYQKVLNWHRWWHATRDPEASGFITAVHPWETGRDNSPEWDGPLEGVPVTVDVAALRRDNRAVDPAERPSDAFYNCAMSLVEEGKRLAWEGRAVARELSFRVCDLGIQSILTRADRDLLALARALERREDAIEIEGWLARAEAAAAALRGADGLSRSRDLVAGRTIDTLTSASFLTLYARSATGEEADLLAELYENWERRVPFGVPSTNPSDPAFDLRRYWRGPTWLIVNRMIADGFAAYGKAGLAQRIAYRSRDLVLSEGFREFFDPRSGAGLGGLDFSWSAAMWLEWLSPELIHSRMTDA